MERGQPVERAARAAAWLRWRRVDGVAAYLAGGELAFTNSTIADNAAVGGAGVLERPAVREAPVGRVDMAVQAQCGGGSTPYGYMDTGLDGFPGGDGGNGGTGVRGNRYEGGAGEGDGGMVVKEWRRCMPPTAISCSSTPRRRKLVRRVSRLGGAAGSTGSGGQEGDGGDGDVSDMAAGRWPGYEGREECDPPEPPIDPGMTDRRVGRRGWNGGWFRLIGDDGG